MQFLLAIPFFCAALSLVRAEDNRLSYFIPVGDTIDVFTADFDATCSTWAPAISQGLFFSEAFVEPGDFQGKNADTEALIFCDWKNVTGAITSDSQITTFTVDVAASLGATPA
ncbi:hypothetical protein C8F04DRAFT_1235491 [Mycena alexandri]|uniref:Uncharacterized protein n=1 Tax=Mycena alexandri TaxID=1745969 RepID=A0AAD6SRM5_9AGAR|nr:hypothetical protein C8F04DRAFT_1235491 [Mycena alexandri]